MEQRTATRWMLARHACISPKSATVAIRSFLLVGRPSMRLESEIADRRWFPARAQACPRALRVRKIRSFDLSTGTVKLRRGRSHASLSSGTTAGRLFGATQPSVGRTFAIRIIRRLCARGWLGCRPPIQPDGLAEVTADGPNPVGAQALLMITAFRLVQAFGVFWRENYKGYRGADTCRTCRNVRSRRPFMASSASFTPRWMRRTDW